MNEQRKAMIRIFGAIALILMTLNVLTVRFGMTCTQGDTGYFLITLFLSAVAAIIAGGCMIAAPQYSRGHLVFLGLAALSMPAMIRAFIETTVGGESLCGEGYIEKEFVDVWERFYAPVHLLLFCGFGAAMWFLRRRHFQRLDS